MSSANHSSPTGRAVLKWKGFMIMIIIFVENCTYLQSGVTVSTDKVSFGAVEDTRVGRELHEANLENNISSDKDQEIIRQEILEILTGHSGTLLGSFLFSLSAS